MKYAADEVCFLWFLQQWGFEHSFEKNLIGTPLAMQFKVPAQTSAILTNGKICLAS